MAAGEWCEGVRRRTAKNGQEQGGTCSHWKERPRNAWKNAQFGKPKRGLTNGGSSPNFQRKSGGPRKSGLFGDAWVGPFEGNRGLFGADRDQFHCTAATGKSRNCFKKALFAPIAPFGPNPRLLSPRLDFPEPNA